MKAAILIAFASLFGNVQGQEQCGSLNSTQIQTFTDQYSKTDDDQIRKKHIDGLKEAVQSICSGLAIEDEDPNVYTQGSSFYRCQMVKITEDQTGSSVCSDNGYCVSLDKNILSNYWSWQCTEEDTCNGVKVAMVMFDRDLFDNKPNDMYSVSFVGNVFILNPITNCIIDCIEWSSVKVTFIVQDDSVSTTTEAQTTTTETSTVTATTLPETTTTLPETTTTLPETTTTAAAKNTTTASTSTSTTSKGTSTGSTSKSTAAASTASTTEQTTSTSTAVTTTVEQTTTTEETTSTTETPTTTSVTYIYQCYRFDGKNGFWRKGGCETYFANDSLVICNCSEPGPIRVFVIDENDGEDNFTPVTIPPCIPITTTTNEPTTTESQTNETTPTMDPSFVKVECSISFPNNYNPNEESSICDACKTIFNVTNDEFQNCKTSSGSTVVHFNLVGDPASVSDSLNVISVLVTSGGMNITINGVLFAASKDSFTSIYLITLPPPTPTPTPDDDDEDGLTNAEIAITVVCVIIGVLGLIVIAVVVYLGHKKKHKKRPVSPSESATPITLDAESHKHSSGEKHHKGKQNPAFEGEI